MTPVVLAFTHIVAFLCGVLLMRTLILRYVHARTVNGHPAFEVAPCEKETKKHMPWRPENRRFTVPLVAIIVGLFLVAIGAQAYLAAQDNAERDKQDRDYAQCLTRFASDLVDNLRVSRAATIRLENARDAKDRALDRLLRVTELAREVPARATAADFDKALKERVQAQRHFTHVSAEVSTVRAHNPLIKPQVVCTR